MSGDEINYARQLQRAGRLAEAGQICREILATYPSHAEAINLLGILAAEAGDLNGAVEQFRRALDLQPGFFPGHNNLATLLKRMGRLDEALESYQRALAINPNQPEIHYNLGNILYAMLRYDESVAAYREAIRLRERYADAHNNLGLVLVAVGNLDEAIAECRRALEIEPENPDGYINLLYALYHHPEADAPKLLEETRKWASRLGTRVDFSPPKARAAGGRLRVGYLSSVFSSGADAHFIYPLMARHDREAFDVFCFNCSPGEDEMTARLRIVCDHWIDVRGVPGEQAAKMIRERGIDVLVAIGQPADTCMQIAAMRCAPVQAVWLAFASATSGLRAMDYRIADEHLDPPGDAGAYFSEISLKLSKTAWCYDPLSEATAVGAAPAASNRFITFGSFNRFGKINPRVAAAWSEILRGEPTARLMILAAAGSHRDRLLAEFWERGIDGGRIEFVQRQPREQYLRLYDRIDIFLDTFPYSGHTTALDSLWMGVPVVTLAGNTTVGRAACSALRNLGLGELVGQSAQEYVEIALRLGRDRVGLAKLRSSLRGRMQTSPLMDSAAFAREMEGLYLRMSGRETPIG